MIESARGEQFLRSNNAKTLAQFRSDQILTAISARHRKISRLVKRTVRPQRHQICVFIIGMGREVEDPAEDIEFLQGELNLATTHRLGKYRRRISRVGRAQGRGQRDGDDRSPTARNPLACRVQHQAPGCERPIKHHRYVSEDTEPARYLLISCFDCSRSISALMLCFCASVGAAFCASVASAAAPAKSPAADLMRACAKCPLTVCGNRLATDWKISIASGPCFLNC